LSVVAMIDVLLGVTMGDTGCQEHAHALAQVGGWAEGDSRTT
jgi:hypothetical protein